MEKDFDKQPVYALVWKLGLPAMAAQFFNVLYNIVDRMFVGNIPETGDLALASIGVSAPALTAISAFAYMIGIGGASLMSISMGKKDRVMARKAVNNALVMLIGISVAVTVICLLFQKQFLYMLGCSDNMYPYASEYFTVYILGTVFSLVGIGMNQFILAQGYAKEGMISVTMGAVINVILDPVLIFGLSMGIRGAALATVIAQACTMIYVLCFLCKKSDNKPEDFLYIGLGGYDLSTEKRIVGIGIMSFLITILDNFIIVLLNVSLRKYGGDTLGDQYIACAAVVQSFMVIVFSPAQGITTGCGTLFGYHYGAGNYRKIMQVLKNVLILCGIYMGIMTLLAQIMPGAFAGLFVQGEENIRLASLFIRKYTIGLLGVAVQYAFVDGLTAMGKVKLALPLSLFRKLLYVACVLLLPVFFSLDNIFFAGTISDVIGASFTLVCFFGIVRKKLKNELTEVRVTI